MIPISSKFCRILLIVFLLASGFTLQANNYKVILVKGTVAYKGVELKKGVSIECGNLSDAAVLKSEMKNFSFSTGTDEVRLLETTNKKVILISARTKSEGRDLMLATRGMKFIKSDFEFKRAFNPSPAPLVLIAEDTIVCTGLENFEFKGNKVLIAQYMHNSDLYEMNIGTNDTIFLTKNRLFCGINNKTGFGSLETGEISLFFRDTEREEDIMLPAEFKSFSLYFLDDIIHYYASVEYEGIKFTHQEIADAIVPSYLKLRQIQREYGLITEEEAMQWLVEHIASVTANN